MTSAHSDIQLGSAEKMAARAPKNDEEKQKVRAAAYHLQNVAFIDLNENLPFEVREVVTWWSDKTWGQRLTKPNIAGGGG